MRFYLAFSGCLLLSTLQSWGQEVAIDLSIDYLSPRTLKYLPTDDWGSIRHPPLVDETESPQKAQEFKAVEETSDHQKLRYWKLQKIVLNAPIVRPHFLTKSKLPQRCTNTKLSHQKRERLEELMSKLKVVY